MATYQVPPTPDFNPRQYLADFLRSVDRQLDEAFDEEPGLLTPEPFFAAARAAFFDARPILGRMIDRLFDPAAEIDFDGHGLSGLQLQFKLQVISAQSEAFDVAIVPARASSAARRPARGLFKKLLEYIDILLKSIIAALGLGDAFGEFKDFVEKLVPDDFGETT
jgi:hypothetical protein